MTYTLYYGDEAFSSWSLRGWLMFEKFSISCESKLLGLYSGNLQADLLSLAPARFVPVMQTPEGLVVGDTLAMAETLAERHPEAGLWPNDPAHRALARWLSAEMHSSFTALRSECPMQLFGVYQGFTPSDALREDLTRLDALWRHARTQSDSETPWLFGAYCLADVFFAPVAARIAGYNLPVSKAARAYVDAHLTCPAFRKWRAAGIARQYDPEPYKLDLPRDNWPIPV
ncbi:MAG: glutathione S-transferase [Rhodobacterales bacterium]|nr:MAG: glutathione S-transferase [Rhodobacterales bacterium]